jgi:predicted peroxiredoxin
MLRRHVFTSDSSDTTGSDLRLFVAPHPPYHDGDRTLAKKLLIMLVNTDPRNGEELGAPFFQASVAAAMDYEVEVVCTATAGRLMKKGVAEKLVVKEGSPKTVYDFIREAHEAGVKFLCCSPNLDLFDMTKEDLIPECSGIVGGAYVIEEVMEGDNTKVLSY